MSKILAFFFIVLALCCGLALAKKGVAVDAWTGFNCNALSSLGSTWWYNWNYYDTNCGGGWNYYAEIHDLSMVGNVPWSWALFGFNEPNMITQDGGSDIDPQTAANNWYALENVNPYYLVSPAPADCWDATYPCTMAAFDWLDAFFGACNGCRVDVIGVHFYTCNASYVPMRLDMYASKYGRPFYISELACPDGSEQDNINFMNAVFPYLESRSDVLGYAWFMLQPGGMGGVNLIDSNSNLTPLGQTFASH